MEKIVVNKKYFNGMKYYKSTSNSTLLIKENELIKRFNELHNENDEIIREKRIEALERIEEDSYVLPNYMIYNNSINYSSLIGYSMNYLKDYKMLSSIINNKNYSYKERLIISKKLCDIFTNLEKYKIAYWDVHLDNILISDSKDIKVCDMDSATYMNSLPERESKYIYRMDLSFMYKHLTQVILSLLYDMEDADMTSVIIDNKDSLVVKNDELLKRALSDDGYMFYPDRYLDLMTEDYVESNKRKLKI